MAESDVTIMVAWVTPLSLPLQCTTIHTSIIKHRWLCTAHQGTRGTLPSELLKWGGLVLRGGLGPGEWWPRQGNLAGRGGGGWRRRVGIFPATHAAIGGTHCSLWGETAVMTGGREGKGNRAERELKRTHFCMGITARSLSTDFQDSPTQGPPLLGYRHAQSSMCWAPISAHTATRLLIFFKSQLVFTGTLPTLAANQFL